jgi:hypothetical protein
MLKGVAGGTVNGSPLAGGSAQSILYVDSSGNLKANDTNFTFGGTAGKGLTITAGTAASAVSALSITQTWNFNTSAIQGVDWTFTDTSSHASTNAFRIRGGASGTTDLLTLSKAGALAAVAVNAGTGGFSVAGDVSGGLKMSGWFGLVSGSDGGISLSQGSGHRITWASSTASAAGTNVDTGLSRVSAGVLGVGTGAAGSTAGSLSLTNLTASGNLITATQSPASGAAGTAGTITWDASYIYICTATGVWKRVAITGGY